MELYPSGLMPEGYPSAGLPPAGFPLPIDAPTAGILPTVGYLPAVPLQYVATETQSAALSSSASVSPEDDLVFLERLLRECHIEDDVATGAHWASSASGANAAAVVAPDARHDAALLTHAVAPWADEMVRQMQGCASADEARPKCAEMLVAFHSQTGAADPNAERLRTVQGANSALLRGFRSMYHKHRELTAQHQRAEEAFVTLASEFAKCQEALRASERAKSTLQYHLQLMSVGPGTAAGGM